MWMADSGGSHSLRSAGRDVCLSALPDQNPAAPRLQKYADPNFFPSPTLSGWRDTAAFIDDEEKKEE